MKKIYCIEQWKDFEGKSVDGGFWETVEEPWKCGLMSYVEEYDDEEEFKKVLMATLDSGGVIGKVFIKEESDDYNPCIKL